MFEASILFLLLCFLIARTASGNVLTGAPVGVLLGLVRRHDEYAGLYIGQSYFGLLASTLIFATLMGLFALGCRIAPALAGHARDLVRRCFFV